MVSSGATLMQTFYNDFQKDSESIVSYGTRLEQTLSRAVTYGHTLNLLPMILFCAVNSGQGFALNN